MKTRTLVALLRIGLGVLFLLAAWPKLADPEGFARAVSNYRMLPVPLERIVALVLPPLELLAGVCLVLGVVDAGASLLVAAMMVVFTVAVGTALGPGLDISCGCFDTQAGARVGLMKLLENVALTTGALLVALGDRSAMSVRGWLSRSGDIE